MRRAIAGAEPASRDHYDFFIPLLPVPSRTPMRFKPILSAEFVNTRKPSCKAGCEFARGEAFIQVEENLPLENDFGVAKMDIILSLSGIAFFVLMLGYVKACERL